MTLAAAVGVFAVANPAEAKPKPTPGTTPFSIEHVDEAAHASPNEFAAGTADSFTTRSITREASGAANVHLDRKYKGLEVVGGDVIAHLDRGGALTGTSRSLAHELSLSAVPNIDAAAANAAAVAAIGGTAPNQPKLLVDALDKTPVLAWRTDVLAADSDGLSGVTHVLVSAVDGSILDSWSELHEVDGSGNGYNSGSVTLSTTLSGSTYQLQDPTRGNGATYDLNGAAPDVDTVKSAGTLMTDADNVWGTGTLSSRQTVAVDAQYGTAATWDYYLNTFGRKGIGNDGKGAKNWVHYGKKFDNAGWSDNCFCMVYGDGDGVSTNPFASLDVAGHEMTHGVTSRTAGLVYSGESGGLNESMSDIFGTLVEFYAKNPSDPGDYLIGEKITKNGEPLRYMDDPTKDGESVGCYTSRSGKLNVHLSSGIANHAFFLMAVGSGRHTVNGVAYNSPTCNGSTVTGIGNDAAGAIFYKALTSYMTSGTKFTGARSATLKAAASLYGTSSAEYETVAAAWSAVSVS